MPLRAECRNLASLRPPHIYFSEVYCDQEKNYQNPSCSVLSFMIIKIVLDKKRLVENPTDRWQDLQSSTLSQRFSHPLLLKKLWHLISSIDIFLNAYLRSDFQPMSKRKSRQLLNQQHICRKELSLLRIALYWARDQNHSPHLPLLYQLCSNNFFEYAVAELALADSNPSFRFEALMCRKFEQLNLSPYLIHRILQGNSLFTPFLLVLLLRLCHFR